MIILKTEICILQRDLYVKSCSKIISGVMNRERITQSLTFIVIRLKYDRLTSIQFIVVISSAIYHDFRRTKTILLDLSIKSAKFLKSCGDLG